MNVRESLRNYVRRSSDDLPTDNGDILSNALTIRRKLHPFEECRILISFWLLGLCNNINYEIMVFELRAAVERNVKGQPLMKMEVLRDCTVADFAAVTLIGLVPPVVIKCLAPFLPLAIHVRVLVIVIFNLIAMILTYSVPTTVENEWVVVLSMLMIAFTAGLGESSFLAYTAFYSTHNNISTWSSGASFSSLVAIIEASAYGMEGVKNKSYALHILKWPIIMVLAFWLILPHPFISKAKYHLNDLDTTVVTNRIPRMEDLHTLNAKMKIFYQYFNIFTLPFGLKSLFDQFVIVGLYQVLNFPQDIIEIKDQPLYYYLAFSIGRGMAASMVNIIQIDKLWLLAFLQGLNVCLLWMEVFWGYMIYTSICLVFMFWMGLIEGASYVNTFRRITTEVPALQREFTLSINTCADSMMILMAGVAGNIAQHFLCRVPNPYYE